MTKDERIASLDGLRAIFGIGIVIYHVNSLFDSAFSLFLSAVYEYGGYFGNYIFFMISGLLISLRYKNRLLDGTCPFHLFIWKRLGRLYPIYALSNFAMILSGSVLVTCKRTCTTFLMIASGWFYGGDTPYNFPAWFLCILMICYILYYLVGKISSKFPAAYPFLCLALCLWGVVLEVMNWNIPFQYRICGEGYLNFFLGILLAERFEFTKNKVIELQRKSYVMFPFCRPFLYITLALAFLIGLSDLPGDLRWWITLICAGLIMVSLSDGMFAQFLSIRIFQILDKSSLFYI